MMKGIAMTSSDTPASGTARSAVTEAMVAAGIEAWNRADAEAWPFVDQIVRAIYEAMEAAAASEPTTTPEPRLVRVASKAGQDGEDRIYVTIYGVEHGLPPALAWTLTEQLVRAMMERANA